MSENIKPPYGYVLTDAPSAGDLFHTSAGWATVQFGEFAGPFFYAKAIQPGPGFRLLGEDEKLPVTWEYTYNSERWHTISSLSSAGQRVALYCKSNSAILAIRVPIAAQEPAAPVWPKPVTDLEGLPGDSCYVLVFDSGNKTWVCLAARVLRRGLNESFTHWMPQPPPPIPPVKSQAEKDREAYKAWCRSSDMSKNLEQAFEAGLAHARGEGKQ